MTTHTVLGTGAIGTALANLLHSQGHTVRAVNRSGARGSLNEGIELLVGDVTEPHFALAATKGADVTYQLTQPAYHRWAEEFPALQEVILDAAASNGSRLVLADNLYPYGDPDGAPISEATPENAHTKKGKVRKAMAEAALAAHRAGRLNVAISRPSNYFGPGYTLSQKSVVGAAKAGRAMQFLGAKDQPHAYAFTLDVARAMAALGTSETAWGKVWILPATEALTTQEFGERIWAAAGQQGAPKFQMLSGALLKVIALFSPPVRELKEMMYEFEKPWDVDSSAFEKEFGISATPIDEAIRLSIDAA